MATEKPIRMLSSVDRHRIQGWLMVANATDAGKLCRTRFAELFVQLYQHVACERTTVVFARRRVIAWLSTAQHTQIIAFFFFCRCFEFHSVAAVFARVFLFVSHRGVLLLLSCYCMLDCLDNLQWHRKYCILNKEERRLHFFNDTEVSLVITGKWKERRGEGA